MQGHRALTSTALLFAAALSTLAVPRSSSAQQREAPRDFLVTVLQVKPDMRQEWRDYRTKDLNPALRKAGVAERIVWVTDTFGEGGEFVLVSPIESLAQLDDPNRMATLLGDQAEAIQAKRQRLITSSHSYLLTARPQLGYAAPAGYIARIGVAATIHVTPGRVPEYEAHFKTLLPVIAKTEAKGVYARSGGLGAILMPSSPWCCSTVGQTSGSSAPSSRRRRWRRSWRRRRRAWLRRQSGRRIASRPISASSRRRHRLGQVKAPPESLVATAGVEYALNSSKFGRAGASRPNFAGRTG